MLSSGLAFVHRAPTEAEVERFRLLLSTFQDGSGMLVGKKKRTLEWMARKHAVTIPGWRDFERTFALAFRGAGTENKYVFDVLLEASQNPSRYVGISCKMRGELKEKAVRLGRGSIELSNAYREFTRVIKQETGLNEDTYSSNPALVGAVLLSIVERWHRAASYENGGKVNLSSSSFANLLWDPNTGQYRLLQFPLMLPVPAQLTWRMSDARLTGLDESGVLVEWYVSSGGQLKYYPPISTAQWSSEIFELEPLPQNLNHILLNKAETYFPAQWGFA